MTNTTHKTDGRNQRSIRSRQQIVRALQDLVESGIFIPTAQQVADEAGISIRTVFRHFEDMESLYAEIDEAHKPKYEAIFNGHDFSGTLEQRVTAAVECRIDCYTQMYAMEKATAALHWRSKLIQQQYAHAQRMLREALETQLPEYVKLEKDDQQAIEAITSFEFFDRLKTHQKLNRKACTQLAIKLVLDILRKQ